MKFVLPLFFALSGLSCLADPTPQAALYDTNPADAFPPPIPTNHMVLSFSASISPNIDHYNIYFSRFYPLDFRLVGMTWGNCSFILDDSNYWYGVPAVTAVNLSGLESAKCFLKP